MQTIAIHQKNVKWLRRSGGSVTKKLNWWEKKRAEKENELLHGFTLNKCSSNESYIHHGRHNNYVVSANLYFIAALADFYGSGGTFFHVAAVLSLGGDALLAEWNECILTWVSLHCAALKRLLKYCYICLHFSCLHISEMPQLQTNNS